MRRNLVILAGLLIALLVVNIGVLRYERILRHGDVVLLELASLDPRSLMQGDYMRLQFAIVRELDLDPAQPLPDDGFVVVRTDDRGVGHLVRVQADANALQSEELAIRYRKRGNRIHIASDAFFFEEGRASHFEQARYGELRVAGDGTALLGALRDAELRKL